MLRVVVLAALAASTFSHNNTCNINNHCGIDETCCPMNQGQSFCCPFVEAVCCPDTLHCCPNGLECDPAANGASCLLKTVQATRHTNVFGVEQMFAKNVLPPIGQDCDDSGTYVCSDSSTCCKSSDDEYNCCPLFNAVCCSDRAHCCPMGTQCDVAEFRCVLLSTEALTTHRTVRLIDQFESPLSSQSDLGFTYQAVGIVCPGGNQTCSVDQTCCPFTDGKYGCCPLPGATCCSDKLHCCPHGDSCGDDGFCHRDATQSAVRGRPYVKKHSSFKRQGGANVKLELMTTPSDKVVCPDKKKCPSGYTCCPLPGKEDAYGCCPLSDAVCCPDHVHCCPVGSTCSHHGCDQDGVLVSGTRKIKAV